MSLAAALEPMERAAAAERMKAGKAPPVKIAGPAKGNAADKIADAVGMNRTTLTRTKAVVAAAATAHPETYSDIQAEMDATGKVAPAYAMLDEGCPSRVRGSGSVGAVSRPEG